MDPRRRCRFSSAALLACAALVAFSALPALCVAAEEQPALPNKPDLDVTYISQRPLYHGYWMDYPNDVPTFWVPDADAPDGKRTVTKEEWQRLVKYQPAAGDTVTFTAHVRNNGFAQAPATRYRLAIDDKVVAEGKIKALAPDEEVAVPYEWVYQDGRHTISCEVDPDNTIDEICEINNRLTDPTWGIGLTIRAWEPAVYKGFRSTPNLWGSYSFEDWCQAHIQEWRRAFREAVYPATPEGVLQGIRFDGIFTSLEDPALVELRDALRDSIKRFGRPYVPDPTSWIESESCSWRINWTLDDIPNYAKKIDRGLIHELCHQCGIIDLYQIGMHLKSNLVPDPNGRFIWVMEGCYNQFGDLMAVWGENPDALPQRGLFREHTAAAFNSEIGKPRWGYGLHLFDLPAHNVLQVLDNRGEPIANADVKLYQQEIETRTVGEIPPKVGKTDANGEWDMGPRPIDKIHVVGTNAVMLFEIRAYGQWEYHTLTITEMNVAYWRGDRERHVYAMQTGIAPPGSPPVPTNLALEPLDTKKARLTWDYPADERRVQKFIIMRRAGHIGAEYNAPFQEIVAETWANERTAEVEIEARPRVLFTVVALDEMGNRSGYSALAVYPADEVLPQVDRVFGVAQTPDGAIYVLNSDVATLFGLSPTGARLTLAGKVQFDAPETVACLASDDDGILYVPNPKGGYVYRVDPRKEKLLDNLTCDAFQKPRGIAFGPDGNLYVTDLGARQVHVVTTKGKLLGSFGDSEKLAAPRNVYVDKKGLVYVVDCAMEGAEFRKAPATIYVFKKTSPRGWDFEPVLTIEGLSWIECVIADDEGRIYAGGSGGIHAFDAAGQRLAQWVSKPYGTPAGAEVVCGMAWNRDGTLLVTQGFTLRQLIRVTLDEIFAAKQ
jgi:outer membrane protein assembly factor BamB